MARTDAERRQVLGAIGPFWDGNEVWLLAAGGVLFLAFPRVLASGLSGFYLAIMLVLWVLILRGVSIEFRSHVGDGMWRSFWDAAFTLASTLAPILFGAALGNLVRGVPLDANGWFSLALWDSFSPRGALGILDWYTTLAGILALVAIAHHGALFLAWRTDGAVRERSLARAATAAPILIAIWIVTSVATARGRAGSCGRRRVASACLACRRHELSPGWPSVLSRAAVAAISRPFSGRAPFSPASLRRPPPRCSPSCSSRRAIRRCR